MAEHNHKEAFCRMKYASDDGQYIEWLWNSRDGVTPYCLMSRDGKAEMTHVEWQRDQYMPNYCPSVGERVFVDLTEEAAREAAIKRADYLWENDTHGIRGRYANKETVVEMFVSGWTENKGAPHVIEVTPELNLSFNIRAIKHSGLPIVGFDLDGTIALIDHRRPLVTGEKKDWRAFFAACIDDEPNVSVIRMAQFHKRSNHHVIIFSGRSDEVRMETEDWLNLHQVPYSLLLMRKAGDFTADEELKRAWLTQFDKEQILCVFDDRNKVVKMWRDEGVPCFQVADGDF